MGVGEVAVVVDVGDVAIEEVAGMGDGKNGSEEKDGIDGADKKVALRTAGSG